MLNGRAQPWLLPPPQHLTLWRLTLAAALTASALTPTSTLGMLLAPLILVLAATQAIGWHTRVSLALLTLTACIATAATSSITLAHALALSSVAAAAILPLGLHHSLDHVRATNATPTAAPRRSLTYAALATLATLTHVTLHLEAPHPAFHLAPAIMLLRPRLSIYAPAATITILATITNPLPAMLLSAMLIPPRAWRYLTAASETASAHLTIYYDGGCGFCVRASQSLQSLLLLPHATIEPAHHNPDAEALLQRDHSWVVQNAAGERFTRSSALRELLRHSLPLRWLAPLWRAPGFTRAADATYVWISHHRPSARATHRIFAPFQFRDLQ